MAHPNDELVERFYGAFARGDGDAMAACYAPGAHFSDPVFTDLRRRGARGDVAHAHRPRAGPGGEPRRARGRRRARQRALAGRLHVLDRPARAQRHPRRVPLRGRADRRAPRLLLLLRLGATGAGADRSGARLDAARARQGPARGTRGPRRVPGAARLGPGGSRRWEPGARGACTQGMTRKLVVLLAAGLVLAPAASAKGPHAVLSSGP